MSRLHALWNTFGMNRRQFLRRFGVASSAITLSPFFVERFAKAAAMGPVTRVYLVKNGDCFANIDKLFDLMGGVGSLVAPQDVVVIKGNAQWPNQGYTHTGCIKGVIDNILGIPDFGGEVVLCDNVQMTRGSQRDDYMDAGSDQRYYNYPDDSWVSMVGAYSSAGRPVGTFEWLTSTTPGTDTPYENGISWHRTFFTYPRNDAKIYLSSPTFDSPVTPGRRINMRQGVFEGGTISQERNLVRIFMPTLNNHGSLDTEDYAGVTSAIKTFYGATEITGGDGGQLSDHYNIHSGITWNHSGWQWQDALWSGELVGRFIKTHYSPQLYITAAMYTGRDRTSAAVETKTVLACTNPVTLDYVACKHVAAPAHSNLSFLHPDNENNTRKQILGCLSEGIGTIDPAQYEIVEYDFSNPKATRQDVDRAIRRHKDGTLTESEVKTVIQDYMEN